MREKVTPLFCCYFSRADPDKFNIRNYYICSQKYPLDPNVAENWLIYFIVYNSFLKWHIFIKSLCSVKI